MDIQPRQEPAAPQPASGPGFGTYAFAAVVLAGAFAGLRFLSTEKPAQPEEPRGPVQPSTNLKAPMPALDPARKKPAAAPASGQGSLGYVSMNPDIQGAGMAPGAAGPSLDSTSVFFAGEGGPSSFEGRVVKNQKQWAALWRSVGGHDMPNLDPEKEMAVAVFGGIQPAGSTVQIFSAEPENERLIVTYRIEKPSRPGQGTCRPYKVVVIPASSLPVAFRAAR